MAIPMQVMGIEGLTARCEARGIERTVSLFLLQDDGVVPGDMVLIHAGCAIQKIPVEEARLAWALFDELLASDAAGRGGDVA